MQTGNFDCRTAALEQRGELTLLRIRNAHADALIALQGAQVLEFRGKSQRPLLWLSEQAEFKRGQPIRGGAPVCWPWFGALERNPAAVRNMARGAAPSSHSSTLAAHGSTLPAHGFARNANWTLDRIDENAERTTLVLRYATVAGIQPDWPHDATLALAIDIGRALRMELSTRNESPSTFALTQALHTYLPVGDIRQVELGGFDGARYIDTLDDWREHRQQGAIEFAGETDRIYLGVPPQVELIDRAWQRRISLRADGSNSAIVWNPWIDKARRLSQFADDAWQRMLCIETANVLDDAVTIPPGGEHVLAVEISACDLT